MFDPQVKEALAWAYTANLPAQDTFHEFIQHLTMALCEIGECQSRLTLRPTSTINIKTGAQSKLQSRGVRIDDPLVINMGSCICSLILYEFYLILLELITFLGYVQLIYHRLVRGCYETVSRNAHATYIHLHTM